MSNMPSQYKVLSLSEKLKKKKQKKNHNDKSMQVFQERL